jgi:serine protease AprX
MRKALAAAAAAALLVAPFAATASAGSARATPRKVAPEVAATLASLPPDGLTSVFVTLRDQVDVADVPSLKGVVSTLQSTATAAQTDVRADLRALRADGSVARFTPLWVVDGISVTATPDVIRELAARPDVATIEPDVVTVVPTAAPPEANITKVGAPALWGRGSLGQGTVVASLDSGVDPTDADLSGSYRGGTNSWYDPYGQHASPVDMTGHGTGTLGVIVGGDAGGTSIGVAPQAKWIAARIWNDAGASSMTSIHQAFQWLLDPDGNAATDDAPDVVNLSWSLGTAPGCDLSLQPDLQALRAAGILPVVAAGNFGPSAGSSVSPANYPEALAVGAVDGSDVVWNGSGRGTTTCGGSAGVYPELVAPGVGIRTSDRFGFYQTLTGTSVAAPHVTGAVALLLSVHPGAGPDQLIAALAGSAKDLGIAGPDETYGNGRLDIDAADAALGTAPPILDLSISADGPQMLGSLPVADEDVVSFDGSAFSILFDGSDVGVKGEVDAFARLDADSFLLSLATAASLPGVGAVDDSDVLRFDATSVGTTTSGSLSMYLDGSDVGLTTDAEDLDTIDVLQDGRIVLSTRGKGSVTGVATFQDEDLVALTPTSLGDTSSGTFALYFDGSDVALSTASSEDLDAASVAADGRVLLSTLGAFAVPGVSGSDEDVFECSPTSLGSTTACVYSSSLSLDGSSWGLSGLGVDAVELT